MEDVEVGKCDLWGEIKLCENFWVADKGKARPGFNHLLKCIIIIMMEMLMLIMTIVIVMFMTMIT